MIKLNNNGKEYWVGHNLKLGYLIFDPLVQNTESDNFVRLYIIDRKKSSIFKKEIIRNNLTPDAQLDKAMCERFLKPYAEARNRLRVTHCFWCKADLNTSDFGICDKCGWIQCSCGACGCKYNRT